MKQLFKNRYILFMLIVCAMFVFLIVGLFNLQFRHGEEYAAEAVSGLDKELRLTGDRGMIMDINGAPLAFDQNSYNVVFYKDPGKTLSTYGQEYTQIIRKTLSIIEEGGGRSVSKFNIHVNTEEDGNIEYNFYFPGITDEDAIQARIQRWLKNMFVSTKIKDEFALQEDPTEFMYWYMRERYHIPHDVSFVEAQKILSVWQEVQMSSYRSYNPVVIAEDVSFDTVAVIEMLSLELDGIEIEESNIRIYPKNELAAHIVGYMGRMLDETTVIEYEKIGYSRVDLIGISGIESEMEAELSANMEGRTGKKTVEVNSRGKVIHVTSIEAPTDGNNVVLTIDADMQKRLEEALAYNIKEINSIQTSKYLSNKEYYDDLSGGDSIEDIDLATIGGAVVMQVQTGNILAMASHPTYDPNLFTGGLSIENAALLYNDERNPLFNKAISSRSTPGSIFKMVTALAGLMEGELTLEETISDEGYWEKGITSGKRPKCWVYPRIYNHQNQTVIEGLKNSCNYFFFTVADRLGSDRLNDWANKLGLSSTTNVQLTGEAAGQVASQDVLYHPDVAPRGITASVYFSIKNTLIEACEKQDYEYEDELYNKVTENLMELVVGETIEWGSDVRGILKNELDLDTTQVRNAPLQPYDQQISAYLLEIRWDSTENILTGIGQSVTLLTPIGVARYISALVNGGNVYEANLIHSVVTPAGQTVGEAYRPQLIRNLGIPIEYVDAIKEGMAEVVSEEDGGTAGQYFQNFDYIDQIGGKTGTAEVGTIDLENNAWFVLFAPFDQPEIAVVVMIPQGYSGGRAAYTAREIVEYYLDDKYIIPEPPKLPRENTVTP